MGFRLPRTKGMLRRQASRWLARLQSGREPDIESKFQRWYRADPRNAAAFDRVRRSYVQAGLLRHSRIKLPIDDHAGRGARRFEPTPALAAAAAVALIAIAILLTHQGRLPIWGTDDLMLMTNVGEIKQVDLADGSKVTLDAATAVDVQIGRLYRSARLKRGRARFHISWASAPFVLQVAKTMVTAREGVIEVEQGPGKNRVQVLEGAAKVAGDGSSTRPLALRAGEDVTIDADGSERMGLVRPGPDWVHGMLQFDRTPLREAVSLANRYSPRPIILVDDMSGLQITGAFRAGDTTGLASALAAAFHLSLQNGPDGSLILARRAPPSREK